MPHDAAVAAAAAGNVQGVLIVGSNQFRQPLPPVYAAAGLNNQGLHLSRGHIPAGNPMHICTHPLDSTPGKPTLRVRGTAELAVIVGKPVSTAAQARSAALRLSRPGGSDAR